MEKGEHKDIFYEIKNESGNVIKDIDIDSSPLRLKNLHTKDWVKTDAVECSVILSPSEIEPKQTKKFAVRVNIKKTYKELVYDPLLKMNKEVAFSLHTIVKYKKVSEVK